MDKDLSYIDTIANYLPPVHVEQLQRIEEILSKIQFDEHYISLQNCVYSDDGYVEAYDVYFKALRLFITKTGVSTNESITAELEVLLAESLLALAEPDNTDVLGMLVETDDDDDAYTLSILLDQMNDISLTSWFTLITAVDGSLITRLKSLSSEEELVEEATSETQFVKDEFKRLFTNVETENSAFILSTLKQIPITEVVGLNLLKWDAPVEDLAIELLMVLVLSGHSGDGDLSRKASSTLDSVFDDFSKVTRVNKLIEQFLNRSEA